MEKPVYNDLNLEAKSVLHIDSKYFLHDFNTH